jgi:hypothetical protein
MKYYIKNRFNRAARFGAALTSGTGTTEQDYNTGKWIEVTQAQATFYSEHPNASFTEIINMEMNEVVVPQVPIETRYKRRVEQLVAEKYTYGEELRILFNGASDPQWAQHEQDVTNAKTQAKQELGISDE